MIDTEPVLDVLQYELEQDIRVDAQHNFFLITTADYVVTGDGNLYARCEGVNGHDTGKKVGKFDTGKEIANKIRNLAGDKDE
jgi:hypothetical protein